MKYGLLFPGQGSQHVAMLPWLETAPEAASILAATAEALGADWRARLKDASWRHSNRVAQVLVTGTCLAAWSSLAAQLTPGPAALAGYSVGELAAYAAAGVLEPQCALALAAERAALMDAAVAGTQTGLLSVSGLSEPAIAALCADTGCECAIHIAVDHVILAGTTAALAEIERLSSGAASCKHLQVGLASHSSWMRPAAAGFAALLQGEPLMAARCAVATNADGITTRDPALLKQALSRQIDQPVQWSSCMTALAERGVSCVMEVGPGHALARLWAGQHADIPVRSLEDFRDIAAAAAWIRRHAAL